jgi:hypothetical protein
MQFEEIILTARVISITLISCSAIGLPAVVIGSSFCKNRPDAEDVWFYAPLVGAGFVILVCQNLLYVDVPISKSAGLVWTLAAAGWIWLLSSSSRRSLLHPVPWMALGLGVAVYLIHASGLLALGVSNYYGYGWVDMLNYVSLAQFFADFPFHSNLSNQEFLHAAQLLKSDRIGQSVLHSFLMSSSWSDAQQSFGSTVLLSPYLMFFGFLTIARHFVPLSPTSYLAASAGALSPTVATVHLECFFSQSMCMPFLLLWPAAISYLVEAPGWRSALLAGLLLSIISAIYTELLPIVLAIAVVCSFAKDASALKMFHSRFPGKLLASEPSRRPFAATLLWLPVAVIVGSVCIPGYFQPALGIVSRATTGIVLAEVYPWAFKFEGLARLWLGNQIQLQPKWIVGVIVGATALIFICNLISLTSYAKRSFSVFFLALVLLMFIPLGPLLAGRGVQYPYQFYKLLLTVSSVHAFWFAIGLAALARYSIIPRSYAYAFATLLAVANGFFTFSVTDASAKVSTVATSHRGGAHLLIDPDFRRLRHFLGATRDRDVFTLWFDNELYTGSYRAGWINYFARHNRVRALISPAPNQTGAASASIDQRFSQQSLLQVASAIVVTWKAVDDLKGRLVTANPLVSVYETSSQEEMRRLIEVSRVTVSRKLKLDAKLEDPAGWYPVWVSGKPGNASLLTMKFGEFNEFRYDQWGFPAVYLTPRGDCQGKSMSLTVRLMQLDRRLRIECNGAAAEADLPLSYSSLEDRGPAQFGWSAGITSLEGKYPLAENFPGSIIEIP